MNPSESDPPLVELYNLRSGDTWRGIPLVGPVTVIEPDVGPPAVQPSANLVSVRCNLTREGAKSPALRMATANVATADTDVTITIGDPVTWEFTIPAVPPTAWHPSPLPAGVYTGDIETTDADGYVLTTHTLQITVTSDKTK
jgi:hypothetical protein